MRPEYPEHAPKGNEGTPLPVVAAQKPEGKSTPYVSGKPLTMKR
jgi:hypothetical protein